MASLSQESEILSSFSADVQTSKPHLDLILKLKAPKAGPPGFVVEKKTKNSKTIPNKLGEQVFTCIHA